MKKQVKRVDVVGQSVVVTFGDGKEALIDSGDLRTYAEETKAFDRMEQLQDNSAEIPEDVQPPPRDA